MKFPVSVEEHHHETQFPARWPASCRGGATAPESKTPLFFDFFFVLSPSFLSFFPIFNSKMLKTQRFDLDLKGKKYYFFGRSGLNSKPKVVWFGFDGLLC
ncbi:hypothetical protein MtrunA17_Chr5g0435671 [Medicago truncatula]|uniref:Transmembrane protein n=1 Tax=Medicago truncatula TaxID=3880 RepID=A0A396HUH4_MEDTR|nr:hypothetical protein MtrunA17_Chr5g0435671 [Medicago truncatula]